MIGRDWKKAGRDWKKVGRDEERKKESLESYVPYPNPKVYCLLPKQHISGTTFSGQFFLFIC